MTAHETAGTGEPADRHAARALGMLKNVSIINQVALLAGRRRLCR